MYSVRNIPIRWMHGRRPTHLIGHDDILGLSDNEAQDLNKLPMLKLNNLEMTNKYGTKDKQAYLGSKIPIVRKLFSSESNPGYLCYEKPIGLENPYLDAHAKRKIDPITNQISYKGIPRLGITKMLTKRWCELKETYDIYSQIPIFEHKQVRVGKKEHKKLEDSIHKVPLDIDNLLNALEVHTPMDKFHYFVEEWFQCIIRLCTLFHKGEAREILCHGYIDSKTGLFVYDEVKDSDDILITGIVDHLILKKSSSNDFIPLSIDECLFTKNNYDLKKIIESIKNYVLQNNLSVEIIIGDVKTRSTRTIPKQESVIKYSKIQVMYYRCFMEILSKKPELTYDKLLINAQRKGYDLDKPIEFSKVMYFMELNNVIFKDMERLRDGELIGVKEFDSYYENRNDVYDVTKLNDVITDEHIIEKYKDFFTEWKIPVTLRYFAARLSQLYHCVAPLLSSNLIIEYYFGSHKFNVTKFQYDYSELQKYNFDSYMFWFGKRDIEPIKPTLKNFSTYCKYCDYESLCLWKKEGIDTLKSLGSDLYSINLNNRNNIKRI